MAWPSPPAVSLFISHASKYLENRFFIAKITLIALAGVNMAVFHLIGLPGISTNGRMTHFTAFREGHTGGLSLFLWVSGCRLRAMDRVHHAAGLKMQESFSSMLLIAALSFVSPRLPGATDQGRGRRAAFQTLCRHENIHGTRIDRPPRRSSGGSMAF